MSRDTGEEKKLPPSRKKLRDAREKGQVARGQDMVTATTTLAALAYLWLRREGIEDRLARALTLPAEMVDRPFLQAAQTLAAGLVRLGAEIVLPLAALVIAVGVVANVLVAGGPVFAIEPVLPRGDKINPANGLKRVFSLRSLLEILKSVVKAACLFLAVGLTVYAGLGLLVQASSCGVPCLGLAFDGVMKPLLLAAVGVLLAAGVVDVGLQRWLFRRELRMTETESKRERKETEGDPLIRSARRRRHRELADGTVRVGMRHATLLVVDRAGTAAALRYVRGETPVPLLVAKGRGARALGLFEEAAERALPLHEDPFLAEALARRTAPGTFVPQDLFDSVATALTRAGAVR